MGTVDIVINGAGSAGVAIAKLLLDMKFGNITLVDKAGILNIHNNNLTSGQREIVDITGCEKEGTLADAMKDADVFIGVSAPNIVSEEMVASMHKGAIVFTMANPTPEIMPDLALHAGAVVVGTGALEVRASDINEEMKIAAAYGIASLISEDELKADYIIPSALDKRVAKAVAEAVKEAAIKSGVARI